MIGDAPCENCNTHVFDVHLTGYWEWDEERIGKWWECEPNQYCPNCRSSLSYLHEPSEIATDLFSNVFDSVERDNEQKTRLL